MDACRLASSGAAFISARDSCQVPRLMTDLSLVANTLHNVYDDAGFLATVLPAIYKWHKLAVVGSSLRRFGHARES
jgi:hypothetical protein